MALNSYNIAGYDRLLGMFAHGVSDLSRVRIVDALVHDDELRSIFVNDARESLRESRTEGSASAYHGAVEAHIPGHTWGFLTGYGVPVFDLGHAWWAGGFSKCESTLKALQKSVDDCLARKNGSENLPLDGIEMGIALLMLMRDSHHFGQTLHDLSVTKKGGGRSFRELVDLDPQPPQTSLIFQGSRFSFFRYHLAFKVEGENRINTLERKNEFVEEMCRLVAKNKTPLTPPASPYWEPTSANPLDIISNPSSPINAIKHVFNSFLGTVERHGRQEDAEALLSLGLRVLSMKRRGDCYENYILERTMTVLSFHVRGRKEGYVELESKLRRLMKNLADQDQPYMFVPLERAMAFCLENLNL